MPARADCSRPFPGISHAFELHMNVRSFTALLLASAVVGAGRSADAAANLRDSEQEHNRWPISVHQTDSVARGVSGWSGAGPLLFRKPGANEAGDTAQGFRPFWVQLNQADGRFRAGYFLYPIFSYSVDENTYKWSVFELVRRWDRRAEAAAPSSEYSQRGEFEIFPLWFSRQTGDPALSYRALFPIHGTIKNKLFFERLSWTLFPLYVQSEKRGAVTTFVPWPVVRITRGAAHGWGIWPLFNYVERPGVSRLETYLWPLGYRSVRQPHPDDPPGTPPKREIGFLPFYARSTGPGYINEDFGWPFFGYTHRTSPLRYDEHRYFWPFLVQGRGEQRYLNRWAPFYTHSIVKGGEKRWFMWPVLRYANWTERDVARERTQLLFFVYWHEVQKRAGATHSPQARLTHVWPLLSRWSNGAGKAQWQFPSPLEVFFPGNEPVRHAWSPLFALARHDQRAPGETRTSVLWDAITYERFAEGRRREFHLGPVLSVARAPGEERVAIGNGLFGFTRREGRGWRLFWLDFPAKPASTGQALR